jgi:indole-3-glycerol phosphate synthase
MPSFLDTIAASRPATFREQVAKYLARSQPMSKPGFRQGLVASLRAARDRGAGIIAELKRASPSHAYEAAGVHGISVLTEPRHFNGSFDDLAEAVAETTRPVLCKDFIVTPGQLELASRLGASSVLIIVKLKPSLALVGKCLDLCLEPLLEIHDEQDLNAIVPVVLGNPGLFIVGINNRDLADLRVNTSTTVKLAPLARELLGDEPVIISESGIESAADAKRLTEAGVDGFLIGTAFMNTPIARLGATIKEFIDACRRDR